MKTIIHVNQHIIKANAANGADDPPLSVKQGGRVHRVRSVKIDGPSEVVYRPDKPLKCGARVWIETEGVVTLT